MNRIVSVVLLAVGVLLIVLGINASNSMNSDVSRFFTGKPTNQAVGMLVGGIVACIVGLFGSFKGTVK
jgi:hypothetical protein